MIEVAFRILRPVFDSRWNKVCLFNWYYRSLKNDDGVAIEFKFI